MTEFVASRAKVYAFLIDDYNDDDYDKNKIINKRVKGTKKCVIKRELKYKKCVHDEEVILKRQQRFKSNYHRVCREEVNKI